MSDPNLPIPVQPQLEPTSALTFGDLITIVAYKIGCAYYGSNGQGAPQVPVNAHDLAICQSLVNSGVRKFINDGPRANGWKWLNPIAQVDLWPQISYDPTGSTYVTLKQGSGAYIGTTLLTLVTPPQPPATGDIDTSYVPAFFQSMEYRQIWLNGNPPPTTPGWWLPVDEDFTGTLIGQPFTILQYLSPTQIIVDGNATLPTVGVSSTAITFGGTVTGGSYELTISTKLGTATSGPIAYNASASAVQTALQSMSSVGAGNVTVGGAAPAYTLAFAPTLQTVNVTVSANGLNLNGTQLSAPFSFAAQGDYTLPANFGGQYTGNISYVANTNRGMILRWTDEFSIRSRRQNYNIESGTPYEAAVRLMPTPSYAPLTNTSGLMLPRRRWELMTWRISSEFLSVLFPYTLAFNNMVNLTDVPPSPFSYDEALKACCLAVAEKEVDDQMGGPDWEYYHTIALPQALQIDLRAAPKALGYFGNPTAAGTATMAQAIQRFRNFDYQRPTVPVFPGPT